MANSAARKTPGNIDEFSQVNRVKDTHLQRNLSTRDCWDGYAHHRSVVTELLVRASSSDKSSLCVLGAGNCNDLDLQQLQHNFSEIHLVDLDDEAISEGVKSAIAGRAIEAEPARQLRHHRRHSSAGKLVGR